jgi:hypothetical protein
MARVKAIMLYELTPFEAQKVREIEQHIREGHNPLEVIQGNYLGCHQYTAKDMRNYHIKNKTPYFAILTHPEIRTNTEITEQVA